MRNDRMDNLRCLLIFLVVLGHFLGLIPGAGGLYRIIYLFHMPAFLFLTGYFTHFNGANCSPICSTPMCSSRCSTCSLTPSCCGRPPWRRFTSSLPYPTGCSGICWM